MLNTKITLFLNREICYNKSIIKQIFLKWREYLMSSQNYIELKRKALKKYFNFLNPQQQEAVFNIDGSELVLAGAGSGKTSVIVNRIINMTIFGNAFYDQNVQGSTEDIKSIENFLDGSCEDTEPLRRAIAVSPIRPWNIVAITFTNKSAKELKSRLVGALGESAYTINASTFHALCLKILRKNIHLLGYNTKFTIYDADDSQRLIKSCMLELDISEKKFPPRGVLSIISSAKNKLMSPEDVLLQNSTDFRTKTIAKIYDTYQKRLKNSNAVDFDDIINLTIDILKRYPDVLERCNNRFRYIMVDEYQDTNYAQFQLLTLLSQKHGNLCVVGDDDQSIYAFRGADITNILNFNEYFPQTKIVKLEQNYRSTQNILNASNNLISNNMGRTNKKLWTSASKGDLVTFYKANDETDEANYIAKVVKVLVKDYKCSYKDCAVLYRVNALSNAVEKAMIKESIPYRVFGGTKFYERKEIKDIIAYLSVINNEFDMLRLKRIINEPKRGIGDATLEVLEEIVRDLEISPIEVMRNATEYALLSKKSTSLKNIAKMFDYLTAKSKSMMLDEFIDLLIDKTGYQQYLINLGDEGQTRLDNIMELKSTIVQYIKGSENPTLNGFLEEISLYTDIDKMNDDDCVNIMTIHNSKGLEFENVFIIGMEENIFPSSRNIENEEELEEERRIAYVGMTRAKKRLYLSATAQRMLYGLTNSNYQSRFINEIGMELLNRKFNENKSSKRRVNKTPTALQSFTLQQQIAKNRAQERIDPTPQNISFEEGNTILHAIFGTGTVLNATYTGGDYMLKVDFAKVGIKTIMTKYTKVKKIS